MSRSHRPVSRRRRRRRRSGFLLLLAVLVGLTGLYGVMRLLPRRRVARLEQVTVPASVEQALLPVGYARSGRRLEDIRGIVIHYVGNPGTTAINNRHYFAREDTEVCSHFVVGLEGEVVQCLPLWERSAASNQRNKDTISIEVCHPDESGKFNDASYDALVELTAWLLEAGGLDESHVIRHYDITGKNCPKYFVEHEDAWQKFLTDVGSRRGGVG